MSFAAPLFAFFWGLVGSSGEGSEEGEWKEGGR